MGLAIGSGSLSLSQSQETWDAIAAIKSNSPFSGGGGADQAATVASGFDAMLSGYNAQAQLFAAAAATAPGDTTQLQMLNQLASVQQVTIDLFA